MKYRITIKRYHASSVRPLASSAFIYLFRKVMHPFSPLGTRFARMGYCVCRWKHHLGENHQDTPFVLVTLLLFKVPLVFTFAKLEVEVGIGDLSHQLLTEPVPLK